MVRIRKNNETSLDIEKPNNKTSNVHTCPADNLGRETSFYYKESSLSSKESSEKGIIDFTPRYFYHNSEDLLKNFI